MSYCLKILFALLVISFLGAVPAQATPNREAEIQQYITMLESDDVHQHIVVAKLLQFSGLEDPRIFDRVEQEALVLNEESRLGVYQIDRLSWLAKALASSGQEKYRKTLKQIAKHGSDFKVRRYAKKSVKMLDFFASLNQEMNDYSRYNSESSAEINRLAIVFQSENFAARRMVAQHVFHENIYDDYLLEILAKEVELLVAYKPKNGLETDCIAWMTRALANSKDLRYKPIVERMAKYAKYYKLKNFAERYLKYY